jgi:PAS domain S-box-containing protein
MIAVYLIVRITNNGPDLARTEGKLQVLLVNEDPSGCTDEGKPERVLAATVKNAPSVDQAIRFLKEGSFDLVLYKFTEMATDDLEKLYAVCQERSTPLIRWDSQMEEFQSDERLRGVFRDALIGIYRTTPDGSFLLANPALVRMLRYDSFEELRMRNLETDQIYVNRTRKEFLAEVDKNTAMVGIESAWRRKDGSTFYVQETARSVKGAGGATLYYEGTVQDITEKRSAEEALRESKEKFQALVESIGDFIWELDTRGEYVYVSPQVQDILGYKPEEMIGTTPWTTVFEEDVGAIISVFMGKVLNKQRFTDIISRHHRKDGKTVYLETNAVPAIGKNGELTGYRGIDRDVTGRMKVEKALHASNDNLNLLNSITRHDVSNQLTIINGYLDLLGTLVQGEKGTAYLAKARKATLSIRRQIEFSKDYQEMGTREARFQSVDEVVHNAMSGLDLAQISTSIDLDGLEVFADPMLEKVFRNLLDNSLRHGGNVSSISIGWHQLEGDAVISYRDDGVGIAEADRQLLFIKGHGKNTGLGLFLSRAILAITNLQIVEVPAEKGARFDIRVPSEMFRTSNV